MVTTPRTCERCDTVTSHRLCDRCSADEFDDHDDNRDCWNCHGEGYVSHCPTEYACIYPDEGCEFCLRVCEYCAPPPPRHGD